jgi:CheY-like chemotaxis protein
VQDSGSGIPPEVLPRIFEPFFTTKDVGKGTGLGLATVHGIVQQHQGWTEVASTVGVGTTFRLYFPASPHARPQVEAPAAEKPVQGGHETILLVEDEPPVQRLACEVLERQGYRVLRASSGVAALEVWKAHGAAIDLLLTDVVMPGGLSGRRLADQLRAERPSLRVVFTSGYSPDVAGRDLERRNGVRFLAKPYPPLTLARLVRECLDEAPAA